MATRRARIKAVASLPVRRKNAETNVASKNSVGAEVASVQECGPKSLESLEKNQQIEHNHSPESCAPSNVNNQASETDESQEIQRKEVTAVNLNESKNSIAKTINAVKIISNKLILPPTISKSPNNYQTKSSDEQSETDLKAVDVPITKVEVKSHTANINIVSPKRHKKNEKSTATDIGSPISASNKPLNRSPEIDGIKKLVPNLSDQSNQTTVPTKDAKVKSDSLEMCKVSDEKITSFKSTESNQENLSKRQEKQNEEQTSKDNITPGIDGIAKLVIRDQKKSQGLQKSTLDGIVPLNTAVQFDDGRNLNFEVAEVSFDPIVPLPAPSPGKIRPKLKPIPRLGHIRRNSVQGSASESEDDGRRQHCATPVNIPHQTPSTPQNTTERQRHDSITSLNAIVVNRDSHRVRNDSVCSTMSLGGQSVMMSPMKDKQLLSRSKRNEHRNRCNSIKRRLGREVSRDSMTMYDLIFYNPTTNPIQKQEDVPPVLTAKKEQKPTVEEEVEEEAEVDDPGSVVEDKPAPAVQIKLAPDGSIIVDEASTIISTTEMKTRKLSDTVVHETEYTGGGGGRYTKTARSAEWTDAETVRFYRALAVVGTDFSMMLGLFPGRCRRDIKIKFKKEERINGSLVDKALTSKARFDIEELMENFAEERREEKERQAEEERLLREARVESEKRKRIRKAGLKLGAAGKAMVSMLSTDALEEHSARVILATEDLHDQEERKRAKRSAKPRKIKLPEDHSRQLPDHLAEKKVEPGSLVVLSLGSPNNPAKKMLQTYIAGVNGKLTPVALPNSLLTPVIQYMHNQSAKTDNIRTSTPNMNTTPVIGQGIINSPSSVIVTPRNSTPSPVINHQGILEVNQGVVTRSTFKSAHNIVLAPRKKIFISNNASISLPYNHMNSPNVNNPVFAHPDSLQKRKSHSSSESLASLLDQPCALDGLAIDTTPPSAKRTRNNSFTLTQLP